MPLSVLQSVETRAEVSASGGEHCGVTLRSFAGRLPRSLIRVERGPLGRRIGVLHHRSKSTMSGTWSLITFHEGEKAPTLTPLMRERHMLGRKQ